MTDEEFEKFKDFMLQSQAQSEVRMSKFEENMAVLEQNLNNLENIVTRLANATLNRFEAVDGTMAALAKAQLKTEEKMAELAEAQAHSDQRLDALIDIVREWRNGRS